MLCSLLYSTQKKQWLVGITFKSSVQPPKYFVELTKMWLYVTRNTLWCMSALASSSTFKHFAYPMEAALCSAVEPVWSWLKAIMILKLQCFGIVFTCLCLLLFLLATWHTANIGSLFRHSEIWQVAVQWYRFWLLDSWRRYRCYQEDISYTPVSRAWQHCAKRWHPGGNAIFVNHQYCLIIEGKPHKLRTKLQSECCRLDNRNKLQTNCYKRITTNPQLWRRASLCKIFHNTHEVCVIFQSQSLM